MNASADLLMYVGGLIALGSVFGYFVLVDYFQHKNKDKRKQN